MSITTVSAAGGAMPAEGQSASPRGLALAYVLALRLAGHRAYETRDGSYHIRMHVDPPQRPEPAHHLGPGHSYPLGFDDRRFAPLAAHPDFKALVVEAIREVESPPVAAGGVLTIGRVFDAVWAAEKAITDCSATDAEYEKAAERTSAIIKLILDAPATTLEDFKLRARAYLWCYSGDCDEALGALTERGQATDEKLVHAIMRDLLALS